MRPGRPATRRGRQIKAQDLVEAACVYAAIAVDLANQPRAAWTPLGAHVNTVTDGAGLTTGRSRARPGGPSR